MCVEKHLYFDRLNDENLCALIEFSELSFVRVSTELIKCFNNQYR